jgi:hypothetical protein
LAQRQFIQQGSRFLDCCNIHENYGIFLILASPHWSILPAKYSLSVAAAHDLATKHGPGEALARWLQRYAAFIGIKRGLAKTLHSGNPAFDTLPAYFNQRLEPALRGLLESAAAAGEVRTDVAAKGLLGAVAGLGMQAYNKGPEYARRMVALLVDGLRYSAKSAKSRVS